MNLLLAGALTAGVLAAQAPPKTHLRIGDEAPDFTLGCSTGKPVKLSDFRGKNVVVVAFFPAAFTGGCTKELTSYQAGITRFDSSEVKVIAVSTDNQPTLNHWAKELEAAYPLCSDFLRAVTKDYGVLMPERGIANRTTFVVDLEGKIQHIDEGTAAVDITGAETACKRISKKQP